MKKESEFNTVVKNSIINCDGFAHKISDIGQIQHGTLPFDIFSQKASFPMLPGAMTSIPVTTTRFKLFTLFFHNLCKSSIFKATVNILSIIFI